MLEIPSAALEKSLEKNKQNEFVKKVLHDFWICLISREVSLLGRKEVLTGKGKFGIFADGKEVPQVALSHVFKKGDHRSGYYRDQTMMFALGISSVEDFFAQMYADTANDPFSGGRQMDAHFATSYIDEEGEWERQVDLLNVSSDISCTAGQMARAVGLALASKKYKELKELLGRKNQFSRKGKEVCFCTIGDGSCAEGAFWEAMNAASVMQIPLVVSVWDDGYGISVPVEKQIAKGSISTAMAGMKTDSIEKGIEIYVVHAWDYPNLVATYEKAIRKARKEQSPALIHVIECTQPQGHSTSGSHERYKSKDRLEWEREWDCIEKMGEWIVSRDLASFELINELKKEAKAFVRQSKNKAWQRFINPIKQERDQLYSWVVQLIETSVRKVELQSIKDQLTSLIDPSYSEIYQLAKRTVYFSMYTDSPVKEKIKKYIKEKEEWVNQAYHTNLYSKTKKSAIQVPVVPIEYGAEKQYAPGYKILNRYFEFAFNKYDNLLAFGEDVGKIGDVNQGMAGLQSKFGEERIFDTGIREWTIIGQAIGLSMRGFKPIAEIQYLDYIYYALAPLTDDVASLRYRSNGMQAAPMILRTRGHRLEGIWHSGSPLGTLLSALRGMYIAVPRNMVQAAGFYNTFIQSDDPGIIIETLNAYRKRELVPSNLGEYTIPLGVPEIISEGEDVTLVTYGACVAEAEEAIELLQKFDISVELIDVRTLLPFDLEGVIKNSVKKTNRLVLLDEDMPGGATGFMLSKLVDEFDIYFDLDSKPICITAKEHRPPYGSDGSYFSKPNPEKIFETIYTLMSEVDPYSYPIGF